MEAKDVEACATIMARHPHLAPGLQIRIIIVRRVVQQRLEGRIPGVQCQRRAIKQWLHIGNCRLHGNQIVFVLECIGRIAHGDWRGRRLDGLGGWMTESGPDELRRQLHEDYDLKPVPRPGSRSM